MKNSARALRRVQRTNALATTGRSQRHAKRRKTYGNVRKTASESTAIVQMQPNLRITPVMQAEILRLYMEGCSLCEIARQTGRARQTVTKVARRLDVEAMIQEQKEKLVAEADSWRESLAFAVETEPHGEMAFRLAQAFGIVPIIPSPEKKAKPAKHDSWEGIDPETLARAKVFGQVAMERASAMRLKNDELEKLVPKDQAQPSVSIRSARSKIDQLHYSLRSAVGMDLPHT